MGRAIHQWTTAVCSVLLLSSFVACKKKSDEPAPAASVSPAAELAAAAAASAAAAQVAASIAAAQAAAAAGAPAVAVDAGAAAPVLGEVKRFADKEKAATGNTKILIDASKVYDEPDATKPPVTSLSKDLVVTRLATLGTDWTLVEFPSGVGKVSPGWVESKSLVGGGGVVASTVASAKPASSATPATTASVKPVTTAVPSAVPAATASATVKPKIKAGGILHAPTPH